MKKTTNFPKFVHIVFTTFFSPQFFQRTLLQTTHKGFYLFGNTRRKYSFCGMLLFVFLGTLQINAQCNPPTKAEQDEYSLSFASATATSIKVNVSVHNNTFTGSVLYINNQNTFTAPSRVITKANSGTNLAYSGSGQQQVVAFAHDSQEFTITGLTANTTYYFRLHAARLCNQNDEPSGTHTTFHEDMIVNPMVVGTLQATAATTQPSALLSAPSFNVTDNTAVTLRAAINTTQTISYSIQGQPNGFSLSGSTLTPSTTDGNSVTIRATAAASGSYPAVSKDFVVTRITPLSFYYTKQLGKVLEKFNVTEGRISAIHTAASAGQVYNIAVIGNYLYFRP